MENLASSKSSDTVILSRQDFLLLQLAAREARKAGMLESDDRIRILALEAEHGSATSSPWF